MEDDFFVGIYDPLEVRRNILESSRELIKSLQSFDKLDHLRSEKLKLLKEMRTVMKELDLLTTKLRQKMPESHLRKPIEKPQSPGGSRQSIKKFKNELESLEEQLKDIEGELSNIR